MPFKSAPKTRLKLRLCLLASLLFCICTTSEVYAQEWIKLKLVITVKDQNGNPVPNAQLSIPRTKETEEKKGMKDVNEVTGPDGRFEKDDFDFKLTGDPHRLIVMVAGSPPTAVTLTDNLLKEAVNDGQVLERNVTVSAQQRVVQLSLSCTVKNGKTGKFIPKATVSIFSQAQEGDQLETAARTGTDGKATLNKPSLQLTGVPHKLIVTADGFGQSEQELMDDELREASSKGNVITRNVELNEPPGWLELILQFLSIAVAWLLNLLSYFVWWLGVVFLGWIIYRLVRRVLRGKHPVPETQQSVSQRLQPPPKPQPQLQPQPSGQGLNELQQMRAEIRYLKDNLMSRAQLQIQLNEINQKLKVRVPTTKDAIETGESSQKASIETDQTSQIEMQVGLRELPPHNKDEGEAAPGEEASSQDSTPQPTKPAEVVSYAPPVSDKVLISYKSLVSGTPGNAELVYLSTEGTSSMVGKLEDDSVYLAQVGTAQAAFVLFTDEDDNSSGWVYPNPAIALREAAVKEVFPRLTKQEFEASKESITPKRVSRVGERRWKVEP